MISAEERSLWSTRSCVYSIFLRRNNIRRMKQYQEKPTLSLPAPFTKKAHNNINELHISLMSSFAKLIEGTGQELRLPPCEIHQNHPTYHDHISSMSIKQKQVGVQETYVLATHNTF
jgi:hypothetical protein